MHVRRKDQHQPKHRKEVADDDALLALRRIDFGDEAQAHLLRHHRAGELQRGNRQSDGNAEHGPDQHFLPEHHDDRGHGAQVDLIRGAMKRKHQRREQQRERQPDARRQREFAQSGEKHDHGADTREDQQIGRCERGKKCQIDTHEIRDVPCRVSSSDDARGDSHHVAVQRISHER